MVREHPCCGETDGLSRSGVWRQPGGQGAHNDGVTALRRCYRRSGTWCVCRLCHCMATTDPSRLCSPWAACWRSPAAVPRTRRRAARVAPIRASGSLRACARTEFRSSPTRAPAEASRSKLARASIPRPQRSRPPSRRAAISFPAGRDRAAGRDWARHPRPSGRSCWRSQDVCARTASAASPTRRLDPTVEPAGVLDRDRPRRSVPARAEHDRRQLARVQAGRGHVSLRSAARRRPADACPVGVTTRPRPRDAP